MIRDNVPVGFKVRNTVHRDASDFDLGRLNCFKHIRDDKAMLSIGTLGGGNHFIELDADENGEGYLIIHSGSRHLGKEVAEYYMDKGHKYLMEHGKENVPYELTYLTDELLSDYLHDIQVVQEYAELNRYIIMKEICKGMKWKVTDEKSCIHNYIEETTGAAILRKGAISAIYERRIGEYHLPEGSIVIGAGNRTQDAAIVKTMSSALINRMFHVQLKPDVKNWLTWAYGNGIHSWVTDYISQRPDHLFSEPPKTEEPFSTPRSWHMLSDALKEFGAGEKEISIETIRMLAYGSITASHVGMFAAFVKQLDNKYLLEDIIKGDARWPEKPEDRDVLYFLAQSFRARLLHDLPQKKAEIDKKNQYFAHRANSLLKELAQLNYELAQMVVSADDGKVLPEWFMIEIVRDLPRLVAQEKKKDGKTA